MDKEIVITEKICTGCHACFSICPKRAIEMKLDERGFLQPVINCDLCVGCKLCQKACPLNTADMKSAGEPIAYAAYSLNDENHRNSSSGGIFSLLASEILREGGTVYGAAFTEDFRVEHKRITNDIRPLQTSKYVQSRIGDMFSCVEQDIRNGQKVLFSGTPCQIGGLYSYLRQQKIDTGNLLTVDLICHGVPSPLLWEKHLNSISCGRKPVFANFRDKRLSWGGFCLTCRFDNGTEYSVEAGQDAYMQGFFANMTLRESCYTCQFKSVSRMADITLADYWGVEKYNPEMLDNNGTSAVLIHSPKGQYYFDLLKKQIKSKKVPVSSILAGNKPMVQSVIPHPRKNMFWQQVIQQQFECYEDIIVRLLVPTMTEKINLWVVKLKRIGKRILKK